MVRKSNRKDTTHLWFNRTTLLSSSGFIFLAILISVYPLMILHCMIFFLMHYSILPYTLEHCLMVWLTDSKLEVIKPDKDSSSHQISATKSAAMLASKYWVEITVTFRPVPIFQCEDAGPSLLSVNAQWHISCISKLNMVYEMKCSQYLIFHLHYLPSNYFSAAGLDLFQGDILLAVSN